MADLFRADPWPAFNLLRGEEASHFGGEGGEGHKKGFDHSLSLFVAQKTKIANFHLNSLSILFYFTF